MTSYAQNSKQYLAQQGSAAVPAYSFFGDQDTGIYCSGANQLSIATNGTQRAVVDSSGNVGIGTGSPNSYSGYATTTINGANGGAIDLSTGNTRYGSFYNSTASVNIGSIQNVPLLFLQNAGEKARIDTSGNFIVGLSYNASATTGRFYVYESNGAAAISAHNGAQYSYGLAVQLQYTNSYFAWFNFGSTTVGSIGTNGSSTSYNTSSDYRLKTNVLPLTGSLERILAIEPSTFDWLHNGDKGVGFIAHKLAEHIPYAVTGEKDAVDDKGNIRPQGVDASKLVPDLVAALQTLYAKLTAAEARIAALEAA